MSVCQPHLIGLSFKYLLGNTPAVNIFQDLPTSVDAKVLMLGAGDSRHILYSLYANRPKEITDSRSYDITCCDYDADTISRNILLWSMLKDFDTDKISLDSIWNFYYHYRIDSDTMALISTYARRLLKDTNDLKTWHRSTYGKIFRLADTVTLEAMKGLWEAYVVRSDVTDTKKQQSFEKAFKKSLAESREIGGAGNYLATTGEPQACRAAGPYHAKVILDKSQIFQRFHTTGTTHSKAEDIAKAKFDNPTFAASVSSQSMLHYVTDPLDGFHLAPAFMKLEVGSPYYDCSLDALAKRGLDKGDRLVGCARAQFNIWCKTFHTYLKANKVVIRSYCGDAFNFASVLQARISGRYDPSDGPFRSRNDLRKISLDSTDWDIDSFGSAGDLSRAPKRFNVIETSNLADHFGALNVLTVTSGLLEDNKYATMHTETMHNLRESDKGAIREMLMGDVETMGLLLHLIPSAYQTRTTCISTFHEALIGMAYSHTTKDRPAATENHLRICWKLPYAGKGAAVTISPDALASVLYEVYKRMWSGEDWGGQMRMAASQDHGAKERWMKSGMTYHRGSLVALILAMSRNIRCDWTLLREALSNLIEAGSRTRPMSMNWYQEFQLHFHLAGLMTEDNSKALGKGLETASPFGRKFFTGCVETVSITVRIPREALDKAMDGIPRRATIPLRVGITGYSSTQQKFSWDNDFACVSTTFGTVRKQGAHVSQRKVQVDSDLSGLIGRADMIATFTAPLFTVANAFNVPSTRLTLFVIATPVTTALFLNNLGLRLAIFSCGLFDEEFVTYSQAGPNGVKSESAFGLSLPPNNVDLSAEARPISAIIENLRVRALRQKVDLDSDAQKAELSAGTSLIQHQNQPCSTTLCLGTTEQEVFFPLPIQGESCKIRLSRNNAWAEVNAPVHRIGDQGGFSQPSLPLVLVNGSPEPWATHRVNLEQLPQIDKDFISSCDWLNGNLGMMMTAAERKIRDAAAGRTGDAKVDFKQHLFDLIVHSVGLKNAGGSKPHQIFGLRDPSDGVGVYVIIVIHSLRYDLSNHTVVVDAAILPLRDAIMDKTMASFLGPLSPGKELRCITMGPAESVLWRKALPVFVERCRSWTHTASCEYPTTGEIPLSLTPGEKLLCACGEGKDKAWLAEACKLPGWDKVSKYATRAAISAVYPSTLVDAHSGMNTVLNDADLQDAIKGQKERHKKSYKSKFATAAENLHTTSRPVTEETSPPKYCGSCQKDGASMKCSGCHQVVYCDKGCQIRHWATHKLRCKAVGEGGSRKGRK